jgi:hypothetical protein
MSDERPKSASGTVNPLFRDPGDAEAIIRASLESGGFDLQYLPRWRVSAEGGSQSRFQLANGEAQTPTLQGVIIGGSDRRVYWATRYEKTSRKRRPDCTSPDGIVGFGSPGGRCEECPLSRFRSGENHQPACRHYQDLLVLRPGNCLPEYVTVPPTSLNAYQGYCLKLAIAGVPTHGVLTSFGLATTKNSRGITYSEVVFNLVRRLTPEEVAVKECYIAMFGRMLKSNTCGPIPDAHE